MKIGDEVYVHGYIDEIRQDTVIIRNDGGYFGTVPSEVIEKKPKRGKWIDVSERGSWATKNACDQCSEIVFQPNYNYCPNCGARMESDDEE